MMGNGIAESGRKEDNSSVSHNPADFRSLMNYFWNFMEHSGTENPDMQLKIQVSESRNSVKVTAEIPGINGKDLDLKISADGFLSISGEKKDASEEAAGNNYFSEISYGPFRRTIQLPWDLDYEATTARYSNGVLTVSIPKAPAERQKFKKISVAKS